MLRSRKHRRVVSALRSWRILGSGLAVLLGASTAARAAEHITLSNGFDVVCDHHIVVNGRVRVFLEREGADYFEVDAKSIGSVEMVPDQPQPEQIRVASRANRQPTKPDAGRAADIRRLSAKDLHPILSKVGAEHNVDVDLLASVIQAESDGRVRAVSRTGARGLMQLMPATAHELGVADSFAPEENVRGGTAYLDQLLTRYHNNIPLALAAYNAGPEAVDRYHGIPPYHETRLYVARVVREFNRRLSAHPAHAKTGAVVKPQTQTVASAAEPGDDGAGRE